MREVKLYDTLVRKRDRKWFRVVEVDEGGSRFGLKASEYGESVLRQSKKRIYVTAKQLQRDFNLMDYPPVKSYIDENLIEKKTPEEIEHERCGAKDAYAVKLHSVERMKRRHRK